MNASREYTRGVSLESTMEHWAATLADPALTFTVVANADDPLIAEMAMTLRAADRVVWVAGGMEWRRDAAVMLETAGVPYTVVEDPVQAVLSVPVGPVHVIANYTAFKELRRRLTT